MKIQTILEVKHKIKCGQNLFRRPLIEKMMAEVDVLASDKQQQDQKAASDEIKRVYLELLKINSRVYELAQNNDFIQLVKAVEWWCSNDIGVEEFEDEWAKYIARKEVAR